MAVEYCVEDFYNMPPALRRKLFSNVERFRLEQLRQAQLDESNGYRPRTASCSSRPSFASDTTVGSVPSRHRHDFAYSRPRTQSSKRKVLFLNSKSARRLQKPRPVETPYFVTKAEAEWFRSLPLKVRQLHFSPDEQARLAGTWCRPTSIILDSADKALYRLGGQQRRNSITSISSAPTLNSDVSTMASSSSKDSAIHMADVYDSFRWMDEEEELDLKLYDYHHHLTDLSKQRPRRARNSFRRTFSLQSFQGSGRSTPTDVRPHLRKIATDRPAPSPVRRYHSFSRSLSSTSVLKPAPQPSEGPLDRPAQYYQDPEARLKLRVYLASPQKFDEAIEFGFPSLDFNKTDNKPTSRSSSSRRKSRPTDDSDEVNDNASSAGTFFQSESTLHTERPNTSTETSHFTMPVKPSRLSQHLSGGREMTLKMTLTRADLRTDIEPGSGSGSVHTSDVSEEHDDPLRLADLPPVGGQGPIWDEPEQGGVVKKMWSKLKRRR